MLRSLTLILLVLTLGIAACAATVTVDGKTVTVPMIEKNGKAYVDAVALMKALGGKATYTAASHKVAITTSNASTGTSTGATTTTGSLGTAQLPGENGELGKIYTLNKNRPMFFSLKSAEYTTKQIIIGNNLYVPKSDEKLLVLHFTVQNPNKSELFIRGDALKITAVDAMNVNHESIMTWGDAESRNYVALDLKPAQKLEVYSAVIVPAKGVIPKLMIEPRGGSESWALRYDLRDKVTALQPPIADPADTTGATALDKVPAQLNTAYPYRNYSISIEKFMYTTDTLNGRAPARGSRYLLVSAVIKNEAPSKHLLRYDYVKPVLTSTDGEKLNYNFMIFATSDRPIAQDMESGQEMRVRLVFTIPKGCTPKTLVLQEADSRTYEYEVAE